MIHWHGPHPGQDGPAPPKPEESKYVTREEFELYDALKTMCAISVFLFIKLIALGKCGKRIAWKNKFAATHKLGRKSCFCFLLIILLSIWMHHEGKKIGNIMKKAHHKPGPHHKHEPIPMEFDEPQAYPLEDAVAMSRDGRHLQEEIAAPMKFVKKGEIPTILSDVETTCNAHHDESSCNADGPCSWCDAAAVRPACHSIENARNLPAAVFACSKLGEEPNDIGSAFFKMLESLKNKRHHGRHGGHKKHERPPRVESEEDEDDEDEEDDKTEIIAGMPFKGHYAKKFRKHHGVDDDEEPHHKRHGGNHGRHHRRHCHGHRICSFIGFFLIGLHFTFIHKLKMAQKQLCIVTGKKIEYPKCKWSKKFGKKHTVAEVPVQQHVIVNAPVVQSSSLNDSVAQIHEERDKEMGIVFAPAPTTIAVNQHTMI